MKYAYALLAALALGAPMFATSTAPAAAADYDSSCRGDQRTSVFGTVLGVTQSYFDIQTSESNQGRIRVLTSQARVHSNGLPLRPGIFVGAYGCYENNGFRAEELTLATDAQSYNGYRRYTVTLSGIVDSVRGSSALIDTQSRRGKVWVYGTRGDLRIGERASFRGSFDPRNSGFVATSETIY